MIEFPFLEIFQWAIFLSDQSEPILPFFTPVVNYSVCNIGDKIAYIDAAQADPLPRNVLLGIGYEGGIMKKSNGLDWKIISIKWAVEMEDLLVHRNNDGTWKYRTGLADIHPFDNLIRGRGNNSAIRHKGYEINLFDFVTFRKGSYEDMEGQVSYQTEGIGFSLSGVLKVLQFSMLRTSTPGFIGFLTKHLDIQYHESSWDFGIYWHPLYGTRFKGMTIMIK